MPLTPGQTYYDALTAGCMVSANEGCRVDPSAQPHALLRNYDSSKGGGLMIPTDLLVPYDGEVGI